MSSIAQEQIAAIAEVAIEKFNELQQEEKTKRLDRRLFNTKILLKNYRHLKVYCNEMDCKHLGEEAVRRYEMLLHFYINDVRKTYAEIAKLHNVHERTAQRHFKLSLYFAFS